VEWSDGELTENRVAREAARVARRLGLECICRHYRDGSIARPEWGRQVECQDILVVRAFNT
jgi:hypothetical protein